MLEKFFADLHIHIGASKDGSPVKITASRKLNFANIARESLTQKGLDLVGIIDCASPRVLGDIEELLASGEMEELDSGGIKYRNQLVILLGAEVESRENNGGHSHYLAFFPFLSNIKEFSRNLKKYITNINLSTQVSSLTGKQIFKIVKENYGILIPAHIFTPHKSFYGNSVGHYREVFSEEEWAQIPAIELGLSADTHLADYLPELSNKAFLSNSDAHSLPKIAREYNQILMEEPNFEEFVKALKGSKGRKLTANYGLDPKLGKYHRSYCPRCQEKFSQKKAVLNCPICGNEDIVTGVKDRIMSISNNNDSNSPDNRPPYVHQVPLLDIPGIGKKTLAKLVEEYDSEMNVLHKADKNSLSRIVNEGLVNKIIRARAGEFEIKPGGGGTYGKVVG